MVLRRAGRADTQRLLDEYRDDTEAVVGASTPTGIGGWHPSRREPDLLGHQG